MSHSNSSNSSPKSIIIGNSVEINIDPCKCSSEIRTDVVVSEFTAIRLWGQIVNCDGDPIPKALVKLVKIVDDKCDKSYQGIAHTISDCEGFYQFDIYSDEQAWYKILVGKSTTGKEIIVSSNTSSSHHPNCTHSVPSYSNSNDCMDHSDSYNYTNYEDDCEDDYSLHYSPNLFTQE